MVRDRRAEQAGLFDELFTLARPRRARRTRSKPVAIDRAAADHPTRRPAPLPEIDALAEIPQHRLIEWIVDLNPTADAEFLAQFPPRRLAVYLMRLVEMTQPRTRKSRWVRTPDVPVVTFAERND